MPFDNVQGFPPVAVPREQRHDAARCCGERQVPDVGDGWRELRPEEILQAGDEFVDGNGKWSVATCRYHSERAGAGGGCVRYRRRVTPTAPTDSEPVEIIADALHDPIAPASGARIRSKKLQRVPPETPDAGEGWRWLSPDEILQAGDEYYTNNGEFVKTGAWGYPVNHEGNVYNSRYRRRVTPVVADIAADEPSSATSRTLPDAEPDVGEGWRELRTDEILQAGDEADVGHNEATWVPTVCVGCRAGDVNDRYRRRVTVNRWPELVWTDEQRTSFLRSEVARLRSEVERLLLTEAEREAIKRLIAKADDNGSGPDNRCAGLLRDTLTRLGGGE